MITVYISIHTYYTFMLRLTCICTQRKTYYAIYTQIYYIFILHYHIYLTFMLYILCNIYSSCEKRKLSLREIRQL